MADEREYGQAASEDNAAQPQEAPETRPAVRDEEREHRAARYRLLSVCCFLMTWTTVVVMLLGAVATYDRVLTPLTAVDYTIGFVLIRRGEIYLTLARTCVGIAYIVFLVLFVRDAIAATRRMIWFVSGKDRKVSPDTVRGLTSSMLDRTASNMSLFYGFAAAACVALDASVTAAMIVALAEGAVYLLVCAALTCFPYAVRGEEGAEERDPAAMSRFRLCMVRQALILLVTGALAYFLIGPALYQLAFGVQVLFGGYFTGFPEFLNTMYVSVGQAILDGVAIVLFLGMVHDLVRAYDPEKGYRNDTDYKLQWGCTRIVIVFAVGAVLSCLIPFIGSSRDLHLTLPIVLSWTEALRGYHIPVILIACGGLIVARALHSSAKKA